MAVTLEMLEDSQLVALCVRQIGAKNFEREVEHVVSRSHKPDG